MSIESNATYGPISVCAIKDKIYLNHPPNLMSKFNGNDEVPIQYFLHTMGLTVSEAEKLITNLSEIINLIKSNSCYKEFDF